MEKSFLSFCNHYDHWEPGEGGRSFLEHFNKVKSSYLDQSDLMAGHGSEMHNRGSNGTGGQGHYNGNGGGSQVMHNQRTSDELTEDQQNLEDLRVSQVILQHMYNLSGAPLDQGVAEESDPAGKDQL